MRTEPMLTALMMAPQPQPDWSRIAAGHELARGQMPVAHHLLTAVGIAACRLQRRTSASMARGSGSGRRCKSIALSRPAKKFWLGEPENGSVRHDVSLHQ